MQFKLKEFNIELNIKRIANVHYFEFSNNYHTMSDKHPFLEMVYVDNGCIDVEAENFTGRIGQQQLIIHKNNEMHSLSSDNKTSPNVIIIGFDCDCSELDDFSKNPYTLTLPQQNILSEIIRESRSVFLPPYDIPNLEDMKERDTYPFGANQLIKNLLEYFLIKLVRSYKNELRESVSETVSMPCLLNEIQAYINNNIEEKFDIGELCFLFGTNKTTLCKLFKDYLNCTFIDYVNQLKIHTAKIKMRNGSQNFTQIAESLNFSSIHYFSKVFTEYEKMTPTQYIKTVKSKLNIE
jgi:AraC-like DNA-binding protein